MTRHLAQFERGNQFLFGANWMRFLSILDAERIEVACSSLDDIVALTSLEEKTLLDVRSTSDPFSVATRKLGARVHPLDYDPAVRRMRPGVRAPVLSGRRRPGVDTTLDI